MRKHVTSFGFGALLMTGLLGVGCTGDISGQEERLARVIGEDLPGVIPGEYIVVLQDRTSPGLVTDIISKVSLAPGNKIKDIYTSFPAFSGSLTDATLEEIRKNQDVKFIEADRIIELNTQHDATVGTFVFDISRTDQRQGKDDIYDDHGFDGSGVHVYVLDTGIRSSHSEFTGRVSNGADFVNDGNGVEDCNGHGSHVSSTVAGTISGMAKNAIIHPVRVFGCNGGAALSTIAAAANFAANDCNNQSGPCVANMSLGGPASATIDNAVQAGINSGITFVVAAGNENQNACNVSPARLDAAITVGATDDNDNRAGFSNFGSCVDIFAPGVSVGGAGISADDALVLLDGTSMASPHVAGAAALFLQQNPNASPAQVKAALEDVATTGAVSGGNGSPNLLLFNDFSGNDGGNEPDPNSCEDRCGDPFDANAACQCDDECVNFGDCCTDIDEICNAGPDPLSCEGRCGEFDANEACQCDAQCAQFGDCCADINQVCQ